MRLKRIDKALEWRKIEAVGPETALDDSIAATAPPGVSTALVAGLLLCTLLSSGVAVRGQDPPQPAPAPDPIWSGSFGAGLALTGGNSDTLNFNLSMDAVRDPKTNHILKMDAFFLRGEADDVEIIDRFGIGFRNEYKVSERTFVYGQLRYLKDQFKLIDYWIAPTGGVGYKIRNTDSIKLNILGGAGAVWEKNPGTDVIRSGAISFGQDWQWQMTKNARIFQDFNAVWKMEELADALYHFGIGVAASITSKTELKVELLDDFKNIPAPGAVKNDHAVITSFLFKF